jgi:hypothetical protein
MIAEYPDSRSPINVIQILINSKTKKISSDLINTCKDPVQHCVQEQKRAL